MRRIVLAGLTLLAAGCYSRDQITSYTVRKPELIDPTLATAAAAAEPKPQQILGAIVLLEDAGWFFKITGDPAQVEPQREAFLNFVKSVHFKNAAPPTWNLPDGWTEQPGDQIRFATLKMPADQGALDITVSELPRNMLPAEEIALININRWRGQVSLPPITAADLGKDTETFKVGDFDGIFVSLVGESSGGGMGGAPFAPFASGATAAPGTSPTTPVRPKGRSGSSDDSLAYETPEGWTPAENDAFSLQAFALPGGKSEDKVTITSLNAGSMTLLQNVNRWRAQVELPPTNEAEVAKASRKIDTLGVSADYFELVGPEKTILGVIATVGDKIWFVKLTGQAELAQREKPRFEEFVKSLRLK